MRARCPDCKKFPKRVETKIEKSCPVCLTDKDVNIFGTYADCYRYNCANCGEFCLSYSARSEIENWGEQKRTELLNIIKKLRDEKGFAQIDGYHLNDIRNSL